MFSLNVQWWELGIQLIVTVSKASALHRSTADKCDNNFNENKETTLLPSPTEAFTASNRQAAVVALGQSLVSTERLEQLLGLEQIEGGGGGAGGDLFRFDLPCRSIVWPQLTFNSQQAPK